MFQHPSNHRYPDGKPTKVISHDQGSLSFGRSARDSGPAFQLKHNHPDNTHSNEKNGGSKSSPLEKPIPKEKSKDKPNYFV